MYEVETVNTKKGIFVKIWDKLENLEIQRLKKDNDNNYYFNLWNSKIIVKKGV